MRHFGKWSSTHQQNTVIRSIGSTYIKQDPEHRAERQWIQIILTYLIKHNYMYNHVGTEQRRDATPSTRIHAFTDTWVHISEQQRLFLRPTLAVANATANNCKFVCRVNVPCVTPCSSFVASANIFRSRRVLCGASRRENGRQRGDFERQACPQRGGTCARAGKNA